MVGLEKKELNYFRAEEMVQLLNVCSALAEVLSLHTIFHIRLTTTSNSISRGSNTSGLLSHSHMSIHKLN